VKIQKYDDGISLQSKMRAFFTYGKEVMTFLIFKGQLCLG